MFRPVNHSPEVEKTRAHQEMNDKQNMVHIYNGTVFSHKMGWSLDTDCSRVKPDVIVLSEINTEGGHCVSHSHECSDGHGHGDGGSAEGNGHWGRGESGATASGASENFRDSGEGCTVL